MFALTDCPLDAPPALSLTQKTGRSVDTDWVSDTQNDEDSVMLRARTDPPEAKALSPPRLREGLFQFADDSIETQDFAGNNTFERVVKQRA